MSDVSLRPARREDIPELNRLIERSARGLSGDDYTEAEIEAAITYVFGVDTELLDDESYYVVEKTGQFAACGGWSRRRTLFGGDQYERRESGFLDPAIEAAKIRAFFVDPAFSRQGIGRLLLAHCESQARLYGFRTAELMGTLPGVKLYQACGYESLERVNYATPGGTSVPFVKMVRQLAD
jgi:GNAT superfamily N-acetyltransferase